MIRNDTKPSYQIRNLVQLVLKWFSIIKVIPDLVQLILKWFAFNKMMRNLVRNQNKLSPQRDFPLSKSYKPGTTGPEVMIRNHTNPNATGLLWVIFIRQIQLVSEWFLFFKMTLNLVQVVLNWFPFDKVILNQTQLVSSEWFPIVKVILNQIQLVSSEWFLFVKVLQTQYIWASSGDT